MEIIGKTLIEENFKRDFEIPGKEFENTINISIHVSKDKNDLVPKSGDCILKMSINLKNNVGTGGAEYNFSFYIQFELKDENINVKDFNTKLFNQLSDQIYDRIDNRFREGGLIEYKIPRIKLGN